MKTMNMISRRSFLKVAMAAATVSALGLTGCGSSASGTASGTASSAAASSAAASEAGQTFKVGIVNYVDHASLNQIVESVESRLDEVAKEKGVTFDYADYYSIRCHACYCCIRGCVCNSINHPEIKSL